MGEAVALDDCQIALSGVPATDAFGLILRVGEDDVLATASAPGPGIFRTRRNRTSAAFAEVGQRLHQGDIIGFLERGAVVLPILMPDDGWLAACAADGTRVEHGTPVIRYIRASEAITS
jgi:biotin carboxyl carrier protein